MRGREENWDPRELAKCLLIKGGWAALGATQCR